MNLANVMDEIAAALGSIDGLRVYPYSANTIVSPAAIVDWPEEINYDATYGRGADQQTIKVIVCVAKLTDRGTKGRLAQYLDGSDATSVKAAVDGGTYTACDSVRVARAVVDVITIGAVDYLGAEFDVEVTGQGA